MLIRKSHLNRLVKNYLNEVALASQGQYPDGEEYLEKIVKGEKEPITSSTPIQGSSDVVALSQALRLTQLALGVVSSPAETVANFGQGTQNAVSQQNPDGEAVISAEVAQYILSTVGIDVEIVQVFTGEDFASSPAAALRNKDIILATQFIKQMQSAGFDLFEASGELQDGIGFAMPGAAGTDDCADWVNKFSYAAGVSGHKHLNSAWHGYNHVRPQNYISNLKKVSSYQGRLEIAFAELLDGVKSTIPKAVLSDLDLDPGTAKKMKPGNIVGLNYPATTLTCRAFWETATNQAAVNNAPSWPERYVLDVAAHVDGESSRNQQGVSYHFISAADGRPFDARVWASENLQEALLKEEFPDSGLFDTGMSPDVDYYMKPGARALPGLNTHIGICVGYVMAEGELCPLVAHNVSNNLLLEPLTSNGLTGAGGFAACGITWINTKTSLAVKAY